MNENSPWNLKRTKKPEYVDHHPLSENRQEHKLFSLTSKLLIASSTTSTINIISLDHLQDVKNVEQICHDNCRSPHEKQSKQPGGA